MTETIENYAHLIEIDAQRKVLTIFRILANGQKQLYTSKEVPGITFNTDEGGYREFARAIGEAILVDSPAARELFKL